MLCFLTANHELFLLSKRMFKVILNYVTVTHFHLRCLNAGETFVHVENMSPDNRFTTI